MNKNKEEMYLWDSLRIINVCIQLMEEGQPEFYRVIATQLRMLLCDTTRRHGGVVDISLLPRVYGDVRLQPFNIRGSFRNEKELIPLEQWLNQKIPWQLMPMTVKSLIRSVCEQDGGAHVDPHSRSRLHTKTARKWILNLARYLVQADMEAVNDPGEE